METKFGILLSLLEAGGTGKYDPKDIAGKILSWRVKAGDLVKQGDALTEVDLDKVTVEILAPADGTIVSLNYEEGEEWSPGGTEDTPFGEIILPELGIIQTADAPTQPEDKHPSTEKVETASRPTQISEGENRPPGVRTRIGPGARRVMKELGLSQDDVLKRLPAGTIRVTEKDVRAIAGARKETASQEQTAAVPAARARARELGIDLRLIPPGPNGVIQMQDVESFAAKEQSVVPEEIIVPKDTEDKDYEVVVPTIRRRTTARHMAEAWSAPHAGPGIDINPIPLLELRERTKESFEKLHGLKLRLDHFFIAASAWLLSQDKLKILNAYWHEENGKAELRLYRHVNVGIACAVPSEKTKSGFSELVVPSIKHAERLSFLEIVREAERLIADAVAGTPKLADLQDLTFIVNNTGSPVEWRGIKFAGDEFPDPIFAPKTSAILAFGAVRNEAVEKKMRVVMRFDHRVCDGYEPKLFLRALQWLLEHPEEILTLK